MNENNSRVASSRIALHTVLTGLFMESSSNPATSLPAGVGGTYTWPIDGIELSFWFEIGRGGFIVDKVP